jgi:DnaJ family protein C protein 10
MHPRDKYVELCLQDIRRAFKKIALEKHPDKNQDNPNAHDEFVKINTAFEALKDPETRKK